MPIVYVDGFRTLNNRTILAAVRVDAVSGKLDLMAWTGWLAAATPMPLGLRIFGYLGIASGGERHPEGPEIIADDGIVWRVGPYSIAEKEQNELNRAMNRIEILVDGPPPPAEDFPFFVGDSAPTVLAAVTCKLQVLPHTPAELADFLCAIVVSKSILSMYGENGIAAPESSGNKRLCRAAARLIRQGDKLPICYIDGTGSETYGVAVLKQRVGGPQVAGTDFLADLHFAGNAPNLQPGDYLIRRTGFAHLGQQMEVSLRVGKIIEVDSNGPISQQ